MKFINKTLSGNHIAWLGLALVLLAFSCKGKKGSEFSQASPAVDSFTCLMHPQIVRAQEGNCPICGMELVKKVRAILADSGLDLTTQLQAANSFVISQVGLTAPVKAARPLLIDVMGTVEYDGKNVYSISARVSGRIEKLFVKYRYEQVRRGQAIMEIYSPELMAAEQELLFLLSRDSTNKSLIGSAINKLQLLGLSRGQVSNLMSSGRPNASITVYSSYSGHIHEANGMRPPSYSAAGSLDAPMAALTEDLSVKEGAYVEKGQTVFQINDPDHVWAVLNLFADQAALVSTGMTVSLVPEAAPQKEFSARISFLEPFFRPGYRTITARAPFENGKRKIPLGSQLRGKINAQTPASLWLPQGAVLSLGLHHIVLLREERGFRVHAVETGMRLEGEIQIRSGLSQADSVAVNAQYLIDSESFIKSK